MENKFICRGRGIIVGVKKKISIGSCLQTGPKMNRSPRKAQIS
jgi:hypothetical protein